MHLFTSTLNSYPIHLIYVSRIFSYLKVMIFSSYISMYLFLKVSQFFYTCCGSIIVLWKAKLEYIMDCIQLILETILLCFHVYKWFIFLVKDLKIFIRKFMRQHHKELWLISIFELNIVFWNWVIEVNWYPSLFHCKRVTLIELHVKVSQPDLNGFVHQESD